MTRNERIAERIRKTWHAEDVCERVHDAFLDGEFDDLLGPAVSAEALSAMPTSRSHFSTAHDCVTMARYDRNCGNDILASYSMDMATRYRRLAKFMRKLERSAQ